MDKPDQASSNVATDRLLAPRYLCRVLGISRRTLRRWVENNYLPAPIRLGPHGQTLRWRPREIIEFLDTAMEIGLVKPKAETASPACEKGEEPVRSATG
jgi:predicted DNA-binding transcriptional regulator AlpA